MKNDRTRASRKAARRYNVSPVARAVRSVLAVSTAALLFSGTGVVLAKQPTIAPVPAERASLSHEFAKVVDLTRVSDAWTPKSVVDDAFTALAAPMGAAQSMQVAVGAPLDAFGPVADPTVLPGSFHAGPGGVSGGDDYIGVDATNFPYTYGYAYGNVVGTSTTGIADGFFISTPGDLTVYSNATVDVTGYTWAAGFELEVGGDAAFTIDNTISASVTGTDGIAFGVYQVADGSSAITNNSTVDVSATGDGSTAIGLYALGFGDDATTTNVGTVNATASKYAGGATGMYAASLYGNATGENSGTITVVADGGQGIGISAFSVYGDATAHNSGTVDATGTASPIVDSNLVGLYAYSFDGNALVDNDGAVKVDGDFAIGAWAKSYYGNATVDNSAGHSVGVNGKYDAVGLAAGTMYGTATITNAGSVNASSSDGVARGAFAYGDVAIVTNANGASIDADGYTQAIGIDAEGVRSATVTNNGSIVATGYGDAIGVWATSNGDTDVNNTGTIDATATHGVAYGIYAGGYDAYVRNWSTINATSQYGDAIGIGIAGVYAFAENDGLLDVTGGSVAAGMFGYGVVSANLHNGGTINANATSSDGFAVGMLASGGDAGVINSGTITATGAYATGVDVRATGVATVLNNNDIHVTGGDVTGISARASGEDGSANVLNYGVVEAEGDLFAVGITSVARGYLGDASVYNGGAVYAVAKYGSSQGIVASADIGASVDNQGTVITVGGESAYGILALTADGDITVDNGFQMATVAGTGRGDGIAYGIAAQSNNGEITITNDGIMYTIGESVSMGIYAATKWNDVNIENNGALMGVAKYGNATGAIAITYTGDANVSNGEYGVVDVQGAYAGSGLRAISLYGDANVTNDGDISTVGGVLDRGITARSLYGGTANITNNGNITTESGYSSYGAWARADYGDAVVHNTGTITSYAHYGVAYGVISGGYYHSNVDNGGDIRAYAADTAAGILAYSNGGDATVTNASTGYLLGVAGNAAYGVQVGAAYAATVTNDGEIVASGYNLADAIFASGATVDVTNTGSLSADADGWASGIEAAGGDIDLLSTSTGSITAYAYSGRANGMFANADGDASVRNGGDIDASSYNGNAFGTFAQAGGNAVLTNGGDIKVSSTNGSAYGMVGIGYDADLSNSSTITATGYDTAVGMLAVGDAHANIVNNGDVNATVTAGQAVGLYAYATHDIHSVNNGNVVVQAGNGRAVGMYGYGYGTTELINCDCGTIDASVDTGIAYGMLGYGADVILTNDGTITTHSGNDRAFGMFASGYATSTVTNTGHLYATAGGKYGLAAGIVGVAGGDVAIVNDGTIDARNAQNAYGIVGHSEDGNLTIGNGGDIAVYGALVNGRGIGIDASAYGNVAVNVDAAGSVYATGKYATGVNASAYAGDITVANSGDIGVVTLGRQGIGVQAIAYHGASAVTNDGTITADGTLPGSLAFGVVAGSEYGSASIHNNAGALVGAYSEYGVAGGLYAFGPEVAVDNGGDVVSTGGYAAVGIGFDSDDATISNTGTITVTQLGGTPPQPPLTVSPGNGIGIAGEVGASGMAHVVNGGAIDVTAYENAFGIQVVGDGDIVIDNDGHIAATGEHAVGVAAQGVNVSFANGGTTTATSDIGEGAAYAARVFGDDATLSNVGTLSAYADGLAIGAFIAGDAAHAGNTGHITATSYGAGGQAIGLVAYAGGSVDVDNGSDIYAVAYNGAAIGAIVASVDGGNASVVNGGTIAAHAAGETIGLLVGGDADASVTNSGTIGAIHADTAVALDLQALGTSTVTNSGHIVALASEEGSIAIQGGDGFELITNNGDITGALQLGAGDDLLTNAAGGTWTVRGHATDFGDGDDRIVNAGTIVLHDAAIGLGSNSGTGNSFVNNGMLSIAGDSAIDMGTGGVAALAGNNAPIAVLNPVAFTNNGTISFLDGAPDDVLTITGDFAGQGALDVDVTLLNGTSDMLYVDGNIVDGAVQKLNVNVLDMLTTATTNIDIPVVVVEGDSHAGNIQPGTFSVGAIGFNANNFLDLKVTVNPHLNADNSSVDMFSLTLGFGGLNDTGSLAAAIAPGAHSLMASQVGTFRQRMGVFTQLGNGDKGGWVRVFGDKGTITPEAHLDNLPSNGNFDFDQTNQGVEAGYNALITDGVYIGATLSKSRGKQDLVDGFGRDDIDGTTVGGYLTWLGQNGMYADVSYRWMHFDADMESLGGKREVGGDAGAFNVELGWNVWTSEGGLKLVPQVQYTRTKVENIDRIEGDLADFVSEGGTSSRGRLGLEMEQTFKSASGTTWTPYGALSIVQEFDGETRFTVADTFTGGMDTEGTSGLVEFGVNAKIGQRVDVWGGLNYMDGGAIDGVWGGQVGLRYTW